MYTIVNGAVQDASAFLEAHPETRRRFKKVAELVEGFESSLGLELLSTVHWVVKNASVSCPDDIVGRTYSWNDRKRQFTPRQITRAFEIMKRKGWATRPEVQTAI
jgi:hypothetical protein